MASVVEFKLNNKNHIHLELYLSGSVIVVEFGLWPIFYINIFLGLFFFIWSWVFFLWAITCCEDRLYLGFRFENLIYIYIYINYDYRHNRIMKLQYLCMWLLMIFSIFMYVRLLMIWMHWINPNTNFFNGLCRVIRNCSISGEIPRYIGDWSSLKYL